MKKITHLILSLLIFACEDVEKAEDATNPMIGTWGLTISGLYENNDCSGEVDYDALVLTSNAYESLEFQGLYDSDATLGGQPVCSDGKDCGYLVTVHKGSKKAGKYYPADGAIYLDGDTFKYMLSSDEKSFDFIGEADNYDSNSGTYKCFNFVYEKQ